MPEDDKRTIEYRGLEMTVDWPDRIEAAQQVQFYKTGDEILPRIRHGEERHKQTMLREACRDCGALIGEFHVPGCDREECPQCGDQAFGCNCGLRALGSA